MGSFQPSEVHFYGAIDAFRNQDIVALSMNWNDGPCIYGADFIVYVSQWVTKLSNRTPSLHLQNSFNAIQV